MQSLWECLFWKPSITPLVCWEVALFLYNSPRLCNGKTLSLTLSHENSLFSANYYNLPVNHLRIIYRLINAVIHEVTMCYHCVGLCVCVNRIWHGQWLVRSILVNGNAEVLSLTVKEAWVRWLMCAQTSGEWQLSDCSS